MTARKARPVKPVKADQTRNLNPHKAAVAAMWLLGPKYAAQNGGSMDFWDSLSDSEREKARRLVRDIDKARTELVTPAPQRRRRS